jgi:hypothetical protein
VSGTVEVRDEPRSAGAVRVECRSQGAFRLSAGIVVPRPIDEVFAFFADAHNLEAITPPWLRFRLRGAPGLPVRKGTMIDYQLRLHGLPLRWRSEITVMGSLRLRGLAVAGLVARDVRAIFAYRQQELAARFFATGS